MYIVKDSTIKKVQAYMYEHHMTNVGDTVIVGVSGGADSVCLLLLLKRLENELGIRVHAVHVNHGLRTDAGADEAYVKGLCKEYDVPLTVKHADVTAYAEKEGLGCEEAGRKLRYEAFAEAGRAACAQEGTAATAGAAATADVGLKNDTHVKIAVAHHMDDRAETVLFHLLRGTGLSGLSGIRPVRENVIRPLLCLTRAQIEEWLFQKNISYCMDSTNLEDTYTRNKIRHNILPYAETEICSRSVEHIAAAADICLETEEYLEGQTRELYDECVISNLEAGGEAQGGKRRVLSDALCVRLSVAEFQPAAPLLQKRLLLFIMEKLTPYRKDITAVHVESIRDLFYRNGNGEISLPYELTARREYDTVVIEKKRMPTEERFYREISELPRQIELPDGRVLSLELLNGSGGERLENENIPQKTYTKWFDYDKIKGYMVVRTRQTGDYLTVRPQARKTLKKYMVDEKIPKRERERILLLAEGEHVLWVIGHRISEYYKVSEDTTHILQVQLRGERADG